MKPRDGYHIEPLGVDGHDVYVRVTMDARTISELKRTMADANAAMARYLTARETKGFSQAKLAQLELDARVSLASLAACIETEGVL